MISNQIVVFLAGIPRVLLYFQCNFVDPFTAGLGLSLFSSRSYFRLFSFRLLPVVNAPPSSIQAIPSYCHIDPPLRYYPPPRIHVPIFVAVHTYVFCTLMHSLRRSERAVCTPSMYKPYNSSLHTNVIPRLLVYCVPAIGFRSSAYDISADLLTREK